MHVIPNACCKAECFSAKSVVPTRDIKAAGWYAGTTRNSPDSCYAERECLVSWYQPATLKLRAGILEPPESALFCAIWRMNGWLGGSSQRATSTLHPMFAVQHHIGCVSNCLTVLLTTSTLGSLEFCRHMKIAMNDHATHTFHMQSAISVHTDS